ncbi:YbaK/EbsC family protein [Brenneria izadpanahii]|uniref:YbaK/EbsC family protein n=1 Tax=Brenneria izadpanahii TaxID=2722756 RepID=UPI001AAF8B94|nr:YbaK/EbsC family protein [Brenneria izadpanahii]
MTQSSYEAIKQMTQPHHEKLLDPKQLDAQIPAHVLQHITRLSLKAFIVDSEASDTSVFSERYGYPLETCANTLILKFKKHGAEAYAAAVCTGARRLDINGAVKQLLAAQRISFARMEKSTELTGMVPGGITVFGLPAAWPVLIDNAVLQQPALVMGGGSAR